MGQAAGVGGANGTWESTDNTYEDFLGQHGGHQGTVSHAAPQEIKTSADRRSRDHQPAYSATTLHRGLKNGIGENNCFLNVTVQALWHLGPFRMGFQKLIIDIPHNPQNSPDSAITALCNLFVNYQYTDSSVIPPTELREKVSQLSSRFSIGSIADANEVLDAILARIHQESEPPCVHEKCLSHTVFVGSILDQVRCPQCGATSEPTLRQSFIHDAYAVELIHLARDYIARNPQKSLSFGHILRTSFQSAGLQSCPSSSISVAMTDESRLEKLRAFAPDFESRSNDELEELLASISNCNARAKAITYCLEPPLALAISITWTHDSEPAELIHEFVELLSDVIELSELFETDSSTVLQSLPFLSMKAGGSKMMTGQWSYVFRGLVCYYGKHYVSMFKEYTDDAQREGQFLLFDDHNIRVIGSWEDVKRECTRGRYQPVLLLYELEKPAERRARMASMSTASGAESVKSTVTSSGIDYVMDNAQIQQILPSPRSGPLPSHLRQLREPNIKG